MPSLDSQTPVSGKKSTVLASNLERPELDNREYRVIKLENGLEALLVHDPDTDKSSAAMDVRVGSFADSEDLPGQAHAVEHLLFMGTEKYPAENEYSQFLSESGGHSNAYTASTETNYYFEVSKFHLNGALDRFAQFFIAPLFREDCLDRELRAVDSENKKNLQNDSWRLYQLSKSLSNPEHPYVKFSTGNLQTLKEEPSKKGVDVRKEFIKFHGEHYSANVMKLCVVGIEDLDTLQEWVETMFTGVKNKDLEPPKYPGDVLTENELLTMITAKPVMDSKSVEITFPFFPEDELYKSHPSRYCAHLIGHEGPGSVLAHLKAKGWANGLSAGATPVCDSSAFFSIDVRLTTEGMNNWKEVVKIVFQYINMIREMEPQEWVLRELQQVAEIDFRFRQKEPASRFTSHMSSVMQRPYPREWLLSAGTLIREFDPVIIRKALDCLRPDNYRIFITAQTPPAEIGEMDQVEKWYGTEYRVEKISKDFLAEVQSLYGKDADKKRIPELHMPHKNEFIPTNFTVEKKEVKEPAKAPILVRNTESMRVWHKKDDTFWVPKAALFVTIRNPIIYASPQTYIRTKIYCDLVRDALSEYAYDAEISGLDYGLICHLQGLDIEIAGYNHKLPVLLEKVVTILRDLEPQQDRFDVTKERMLRGVKNWELIQPYKQITEHMRFLQFQKYWMNTDMREELELLTLDDIRRFKPDLFSQVHIETLTHGNLYKEDALKLTDLVHNILKPRVLPPTQFVSRRTVIPPPGAKFCYPRLLKDPKNVNSCIEYFLFVSETTDRKLRTLLGLFAQVAEEPSFDQLRTKEQLGYIVWSGIRSFGSTSGFRVLVQSERSVSYLEHRIEDFLANFGAHIEKLTAKEYASHIDSLVSKWTEKPKHLMQESNQLWGYIENENYDFNRTDVEVDILRKVTKDELLEFYKAYIHPTSPSRSQVSVHMLAAQPSPVAQKEPVPLTEQRAAIHQAITQVLGPLAVKVDTSRLDALTADQETLESATVLARVKALFEDVVAEEATRKTYLEQATLLVEQLLPKKEGEQEVSDEVLYKYGKPTVIEDPIAWKNGLRISAATRPVKPLVEYEETSVKL